MSRGVWTWVATAGRGRKARHPGQWRDPRPHSRSANEFDSSVSRIELK